MSLFLVDCYIYWYYYYCYAHLNILWNFHSINLFLLKLLIFLQPSTEVSDKILWQLIVFQKLKWTGRFACTVVGTWEIINFNISFFCRDCCYCVNFVPTFLCQICCFRKFLQDVIEDTLSEVVSKQSFDSLIRAVKTEKEKKATLQQTILK